MAQSIGKIKKPLQFDGTQPKEVGGDSEAGLSRGKRERKRKRKSTCVVVNTGSSMGDPGHRY